MTCCVSCVILSAYTRGHKHTGIRTHECNDCAKLNTQLKQTLEAEEDTSTERKTWQIYLLSLSLSLSVSLSLCLYLCLSVCVCVCVSLSLSLSSVRYGLGRSTLQLDVKVT